MYNLKKKSAVDRIKWVEDNEDNIINFENGILINQAEFKLLFISFCFEYKNYILSKNNDKYYFVTHLPIQLDATCNGFQHISMLGIDEILLPELNIKKASNYDVPDDFYSFIAILIKGKLYELINDLNLPKTDKIRYERLYNLDIHRNIIKKCIMTIPYNTTHLQGIKYLRENFEFDLDENLKYNNLQNKFYKLCIFLLKVAPISHFLN